MAQFISQPALTLQELTLYPAYVPKGMHMDRVSLRTPLASFRPDKEKSRFYLNVPFMAAIMQALAGPNLLAELSMRGGCGFTPSSIPLDDAIQLYRDTQKIKAGFVYDPSSVTEEKRLEDVLDIQRSTGHSTVPVLGEGKKLIGIITGREFWPDDDPRKFITDKMIQFRPYKGELSVEQLNNLAEHMHELRREKGWDELGKLENSREYQSIERVVRSAPFAYGLEGISLTGANLLMRMANSAYLPIIDKEGKLKAIVFKKDYIAHADNPNELADKNRRPIVGIGLNTEDFRERVKKFVAEGATLFCVDSSHVNEYQLDALKWCRKEHPELIFGAGNGVAEDMFLEAVKAGADFFKPGIGGGSICITREQQAVGVAQATAVIDVVAARDNYHKATGIYVPIVSDGAIVYDHDFIIALALGADAVMMGRYFARFEENPWPSERQGGVRYNPYWGEGSLRAKNWMRYGRSSRKFIEQGVDGLVPCVGVLREGVESSLDKLRKTMADYMGAQTLEEFMKKSRVRPVSQAALVESGHHDIITKENIGLGGSAYRQTVWGVK